MENEILNQISLKPKLVQKNNIFKVLLWLILGNLAIVLGLHILTQGMTTVIIHYILALGFIGPTISLFLSRYSIKKTFDVVLIDDTFELTSKQKFYYDIVIALSKNANLKKFPEIGIYNSHEINAFATGYNRNHALIAVSSQLLEEMDCEEITGVVGHEMAHIINGDMVTMTILRGLINTLVYTVCAPFLFYHWLNKKDYKSTLFDIILTLWIYKIIKKIASFFGDLVAKGFSRHREFKADMLSSLLTKKEYMTKALIKLKSQTFQKEDEFQASYSMLKINASPSVMDIFSTHPSINRRLVNLEKRKSDKEFSKYAERGKKCWNNLYDNYKNNYKKNNLEKGENEKMEEKDELLKVYLDLPSEKAFFKYKKAFDLYEEKGGIAWSWNWAAFFLGSYYLFFRKSYLMAILMGIVTNLVAMLFMGVLPSLAIIVLPLIAILRGGFYNYINYLRYKKCLEKATVNGTVNKEILRKLGGFIFS